MKKKKMRNFKLIFSYLKDEKLRIFLYVLLVGLTYLPVLLSTFFWGYAIDALINKVYDKFLMFLIFRESMHIVFYCLLAIPRYLIYNYLEIKFSKNVLKDLYSKISEMPVVAFEKIGVGEFINRMTTDPDRVMDLLSRLMKMACRAIVIIVVLVIAFASSIILGIEIIVFGFVMGFVSYKYFPKIKKTQESIKKESDLQVKTATENLTGIREIKALGIKKNIEDRLFLNIDRLFVNQRKMRKYEVGYYCTNNFIYFVLETMI